MKPSTFIKLDRNILDSSYFDDAEVLRVWITLLILAAHKNTEVNGIELLRGQLLTTYAALCERLGLSLKKIRIILDRFEADGSIFRESVKNRYTIITIVNYELYQGGANQTANQIEKKGKPNGKPKNADEALKNNGFCSDNEPIRANQTANQIEKKGKPNGNDTRIFKEYLKESHKEGKCVVVNNLPEETKDKQNNNKDLYDGDEPPLLSGDEYYQIQPIYGVWTDSAVMLSPYQSDKLGEILSFEEYMIYTERLSNFLEKVACETGEPPNINHYRTILKWVKEDRRA
ncbi:MAG: hypothetical protein IKJ88_00830 [Clostridia bacterium]|nr:hypothetical protein [Clostridia bacterium]